MPQDHTDDAPWVIFRLHEQLFGLPAFDTREMLELPTVTPIPRAPEFIRGVINLRGEVITLVDLRLRLNIQSAQADRQELISLLEQREQDHLNWLNELESSLREKRSFRLTTDPHACAFGRWYDGFTTDDLRLSSLLLKFDLPHKRIHAIGEEARHLMDAGRPEAALDLIERTREGALASMVRLFGEARETLRRSANEIALVVERGGISAALTVDAVDSVEALEPGSLGEMPGGHATYDNLVSQIGKRQGSQQMVLLLDVGSLLEQTKGLGRA